MHLAVGEWSRRWWHDRGGSALAVGARLTDGDDHGDQDEVRGICMGRVDGSEQETRAHWEAEKGWFLSPVFGV